MSPLRRITRLRYPADGGLISRREHIFTAIAGAGLLLALPAYLPAMTMAFRRGLWGLVLLDSLLYLLAGAVFLARGVRLEIRAAFGLLLLYSAGVGVISSVGILSGGPFYLFAFSVLAGVFVGLKTALAALGINAVTLTLLGWMFHTGALGAGSPFFPSPVAAAVAGANFIFLNAVAAVSVSALTRSLEDAFAKEKAAKESLRREIEIRRLAEASLRQSEKQYRLLAENITDVIWTADLELNLTYISPAVKRMQGYAEEEIPHLTVADLLTEDSMQKAGAVLKEQLRLGEAEGDFQRRVTLELEQYRKDGSSLWTEIQANFLLDEQGRPEGILGVTRDITERRRSEKEKKDLQERLDRSRKMEALGLLAGGVAHDLNNVLSGVVSYPDMLLMDLPRDSPLREPVATIRDSGRKAAEIVQDLLALARRGVSSTTVLDINELIEDYVRSPEHLELGRHHPGVAVTTDLAEDLLPVRGTPLHLRKTVMNLVANAAEAQPEGGWIRIATLNRYVDRPLRGFEPVPEGEFVVVEVSDNGVGISDKDLSRIFEPFYTKKVMGRSGTGLGMAVVWGTMQDHKGHIQVSSREGGGTTFSLYFPASRQALPSRDPVPPPDSYRGSGQEILVVDDRAEQREIASRILERLGYRAFSVSSGEEAVAFLRRRPVALLILDMIMEPGIDGLETYRKILAIRPGQKVLIASGFAETDRVREALRLGAGAYLKKPYTMSEIGTMTARMLRDS